MCKYKKIKIKRYTTFYYLFLAVRILLRPCIWICLFFFLTFEICSQEVIDEYLERSKRRGSDYKEIDAKCLRWRPRSAAPAPAGPTWNVSVRSECVHNIIRYVVINTIFFFFLTIFPLNKPLFKVYYNLCYEEGKI